MPAKRHSSGRIISKLHEAEVHLAQGMTILVERSTRWALDSAF